MCLLTNINAGAYWIFSSGKWSETLERQDFMGPSGFKLIDELESDPAEVELVITSFRTTPQWKVNVKRSDTLPDGLELYIKRTGEGTISGGGSIEGGTDYVQVNTTEDFFFAGQAKWVWGIPIQFKLQGLSSVLFPGTFSTTITYTITAQ